MVFNNISNKGITDNELLHLYLNDNNSLALSLIFERYKPLIVSKINAFGFKNSEFDDAFQECMLVLFTAVNHFNAQKASFFTYINVCINRALVNICRKNQVKEIPLGDSQNINTYFDNQANFQTPQNIFEDSFNYNELVYKVKKSLSKLEYSVLQKMFLGLKYSEIANELSISIKSVDNAVQRIRNKLSKI